MPRCFQALNFRLKNCLISSFLTSIFPLQVESVPDETTQRVGSEDCPARPECVPPRSPRICRTLSMCETTAPSRTVKSATCSWPRGILKHRTRSLSESQVGAVTPQASLASSLDLDLPEDLLLEGEAEEEEEEGSMASSLGEKKSVRFNEVVSRQLFRTNRSILVERAKAEKMKQRRRRNKARRPSESDRTSESCSDRESGESGRRRRRETEGSSEEQTSATATTTTDDDTTTDTCDVDDLENNNCNYAKSSKNSSRKKETKNKSEGGEAEKSKKKRRKNKKNKKFEPSNNFIFQLDIEP